LRKILGRIINKQEKVQGSPAKSHFTNQNMNNPIVKASIADVQIGLYVIQGLFSENGDFGVGVPQIAEDFLLSSTNTAARDLQRMMGKDFKTSKWVTELNKKAINVILFEDFPKVLLKLYKKGNTLVDEIVENTFGLSWQQLFCDAFDIKFEKEDRQKWLMCRQRTKLTFRPFTDQLKAYGFKTPCEYAKFISMFQSKLGIENGTRDRQSLEKLFILEESQVKLATYIECGLTPWQALNKL
jgi:hypothetical protein